MTTDSFPFDDEQEATESVGGDRWIDEAANQFKVVVAVSCYAALMTASICAGEILIRRSSDLEITPIVFILNALLAMLGSGVVSKYRRGNAGDVIAAMLLGCVIGMFAYVAALIVFCAAFLLLGCLVAALLYGTSVVV